MALHLLTDREVKNARALESERLLSDGGGLYLRVLPTGQKSWVFRYSMAGARRKLSLGGAADVTLAAAREAAAKERANIASGTDPHVAVKLRQAEQAAESERLHLLEVRKSQEASTLQDMFNAWITDGVQRADDNAELQRTFKKDILRTLGSRPVRSLTDSDIRDALRKVGRNRKRSRTAERMLSEVRQMFRWAGKRQPWKALLVDGNPAELVETKQVVQSGYEAVVRDRVLDASEIRELRDLLRDTTATYEAAVDRRVADRPLQIESQLALWICLGTACRIGELLQARWEHVDLKAKTWFVPKQNTKTGVDWLVYLSDFALQAFSALHKRTGSGDDRSPWCFPARHKEGHVDLKTISKQVGDRQMKFKQRKPLKNRRNDNTLMLSGGKRGEWTPHDLRRTAATMMQALGVSLDVIDRCQNHVLPGTKVRRHYLHHDYAEEKRDAWNRLGARLQEILAGAEAAPNPASKTSPPRAPTRKTSATTMSGTRTASRRKATSATTRDDEREASAPRD